MQWILQDFEDNQALAETLSRLGLKHSMHKVVPFIGQLDPEPRITEQSVILFGSYSLRHYAEKHKLSPGVFQLRPYIHEDVWKGHMVNDGAMFYTVRDCPMLYFFNTSSELFVRPVEDSKEIAGAVMDKEQIFEMSNNVCSLKPEELIKGSLQPDTMLMFSAPKKIVKEWRTWVVDGKIVTYSLYKQGSRVLYRPEIDAGALKFAEWMVDLNPNYSPAYVLDVCETEDGYELLETNCINAAGFYAADLNKLAIALERLSEYLL